MMAAPVTVHNDVWPLVARHLSLSEIRNLVLVSRTFCKPRSEDRSVIELLSPKNIAAALKIARLMNNKPLMQKIEGQKNWNSFSNSAQVEIVLMAYKGGNIERVNEIFRKDGGLICSVAFCVDEQDLDIKIARDLTRFWLKNFSTPS